MKAPSETDPRENPQAAKGQAAKGAVRAQIEENLKRAYDAALNEDIPDRFKDLIAQLRAKDGQT